MNQHRPDTASPFGEDLWEVLARYVAGESPSAEAAGVREWLAKEPKRQELVTALGRAVNGLIDPGAQVDVESALRKVSARLRAPDVRELRPRTWRTMGLRAAAAVVLVAGAALVWRSASVPAGNTPAIAARTFSTPVGRTDSIRLDDGSLAVLGPASTLTVAAGYGNESRSLELTGVGLFDVVHDAQRPFRVQAGGTTIEDLGTTFTVRSEAGETSVIVTQGSVRVHAPVPVSEAQPKEGVVLKAGDRAAVRDGQPVVERATATDDDLAWTRGRLVFDDAPIARVRADIRRWYGVELELKDSALARRHLTASFSGEPVDQVLRVIGLALAAHIERRGDTAVIRPR